MDDIRVDSVHSYDAYGERRPPDPGRRRKHEKAGASAQTASEDFFQPSGPESRGAESATDYFTPSDRPDPES